MFKTPRAEKELLRRLSEMIGNFLPLASARKWRGKVNSANLTGQDQTQVWVLLVIWLLDEAIQYAKTDELRSAIVQVTQLYRTGCTDRQQWEAAEKVACAETMAAYESHGQAACGEAAVYAARAVNGPSAFSSAKNTVEAVVRAAFEAQVTDGCTAEAAEISKISQKFLELISANN